MPNEIEAAFAKLAQQAGCARRHPWAHFFIIQDDQIVALAAQHRDPNGFICANTYATVVKILSNHIEYVITHPSAAL